jgi:hypothetical protein
VHLQPDLKSRGDDAAAEADGAQLRALAERKLPEVDALIAPARAMRAWLVTASGCNCETLDVCALFEDAAPPQLRVVHVAG